MNSGYQKRAVATAFAPLGIKMDKHFILDAYAASGIATILMDRIVERLGFGWYFGQKNVMLRDETIVLIILFFTVIFGGKCVKFG